jgi:hypothetical protein
MDLIFINGLPPNPLPSPLDVIISNAGNITDGSDPSVSGYTGSVTAAGKKYTLTRLGAAPHRYSAPLASTPIQAPVPMADLSALDTCFALISRKKNDGWEYPDDLGRAERLP